MKALRAVGAVRALPIRAEYRKVCSTKLWWGLLVPVVLLSLVINAFSGAFTAEVPESMRVPLLPGSLAYALGPAGVFAAVQGVVAAAAEHRHRTITTTYLTTHGRAPVLLAKMLACAGVGACYAVATLVVGGVAGTVSDGDAAFPALGPLVAGAGIGTLVVALWGALGAALGIAVSNQAGALVAILVYLLLGELVLGALLGAAESQTVRALSAYLPVNAGEVAIYHFPAREIAGPETGAQLVEVLAGVVDPPPWGVALLVLAAWTAAVGGVGWLVAGRRDIT